MSSDTKYFENISIKSDRLIRSYFHNFEFFPNIDMHIHDFYELNVIIKGAGKHHVGDNSFDMKPGAVFLIPPFVKHGYSFENNNFSIFHILFKNFFFEKYKSCLNDISGHNIMFEMEPALRLQQEKKINFVLYFDITKEQELLNTFEKLAALEEKESSNIRPRQELLTLYLISSLCEKIETYQDKKPSTDSQFYYVMKAVEYMQSNYNEKIDLREMCNIAHMSRASFFRHFKTCFDCTPLQYLHNYRIKQAMNLLKNTDKSVATIAQDCGFFDSSNFIHLFIQSEGLSPLKYRQKFLSETKP